MLSSALAVGLALVLLVTVIAVMLHARSLRRKSLFSRREALDAQMRLDAVLGAQPKTAFIIDCEQRVVGKLPPTASRMLGRDCVAGTTLSSLLGGNVADDRRLQAVSYLEALLRGEPATNPLSAIAIHGRILDFAFEKIAAHSTMAGILVIIEERQVASQHAEALPVVTEATIAPAIAAEAIAAQEQPPVALAPADDVGAITVQLKRDGTALAQFLQDASSKASQVRAMLRMPARAEPAFREKLNRIQELIVALRERAAAQSLDAVVQQSTSFEDLLLSLSAKPTLTGNDFLPLAAKLDDLFSHLAWLSDSLGRDAAPAQTADEPIVAKDCAETHAATQLLPAPSMQDDVEDLGEFVRRLAMEVAAASEREVSVVAIGLDEVPDEIQSVIGDVLNQLVRNAVLHGLELPQERARRGKAPAGTFVVQFDADERNAFNLSFQDDGRGLDYNRIRAVAIEQGLLTEAVAERIDPRKLASLIFRPGFSTAMAGPSHIQGLGMDLVRERVHALGGKVGVATKPGEFTRFRIMLPRVLRQQVA